MDVVGLNRDWIKLGRDVPAIQVPDGCDATLPVDTEVEIVHAADTFLMRQRKGVEPFRSDDPETERLWWNEVGVNQNLTFPVQPDPVSGMHCWHQKVVVESARVGDRYGDIFVDTKKSREVFAEWSAKARAAPGPGDLRRPLWLNRPMHPTEEAYRFPD